MIIHVAMAPVRSRRTVRSMLVLALLALAGGAPARRGAYAEVAAATRVSHVAAVRRATVAVVTPARAPASTVAAALPRTRDDVPVARLYLVHAALLL